MTAPHESSDRPVALGLTLQTLGGAGLYSGEPSELVLGPGKPFALLTYLALAPGRSAVRESLFDLLWADVEPDRARNALRQTLFQLRRLLGDTSIVGAQELTLTCALETDRDLFLRALELGDLDGAVAQYRGQFLPAFGVPGGAAFEQWADHERARLRTGFLRAADVLGRRHLDGARFKEARQIARWVREVAEDNEAAGRALLETSMAAGDVIGAAMEAQNLELWATSEGVELEPGTRAAIARARRVRPDAEPDHSMFTLVAELTGREREFSAITSAWNAVRAGPARHLHLSAPAGFGKTRLLQDAIARLSASGATVVSLRGSPGDRDVPYAFAGDLAAALTALPGAAGVAPASAATLIALNPALSTRFSGAADTAVGEEALRRRILALTDLVHSVAEEQRFVLTIDDLHWIDPPSFRVLEGLWGRLNGAHVLCLSAARPERVPRTDGCRVLPLTALSAPQVGALVSALGVIPLHASWAVGFVAGLHDATRGSPLLVLETLRHALDQEVLSLGPDEWHCLDPARLATLLRAGEALRERVRALPESQVWVLALLATSGVPFDRQTLARIMGVSRDALADLLEPLERQGLAIGTGSGWVPAHDEIAEAARAALSAEQRTAAHRAIGAYFARATGDDATGLLRALRHYVAADDVVMVRQLHRRYAQQARRRGDRRPYASIAAECVGDDDSSTRVASLVNDLPRAWRLGLWSRTRQFAALVALVLVPATSVQVWRSRTAARTTRQRVVLADASGATSVIPIRPEAWDDVTTPLERTSGHSAVVEAATGFPGLSPAVSPDGDALAWVQDAGDSTTLDIWLRTPRGTRRLTREFRDDLVQGWLPDGSALVGTTNRWSPVDNGDYDIAVFDTVTGSARAVTRGPSHDTQPYVSPDGTRVAFLRQSDEYPARACVTTIDGAREPACRLVAGRPVNSLLGWSGLDELVLTVETPDSLPLVIYDWARDTERTILGPHAQAARLSPDRRWVLTALRLDGIRGTRDWVVPLDRPGQARPIAPSAQEGTSIRWWEGPPDRRALITRIEFADTAQFIPLGIGTRLRVRPLTADRIEVPLHVPVTWTSSDTQVATVDSNGEIRPRAAGTTTISASLVGWRTVRRRLEVRGEPATTIVDERWDDQWRRRWIVWGDPQPLVREGPGGVRAFFNNGDGSYPSMGVLRAALSARHGLGVELRVSTPFTRTKWQRLRTSLVPELDTTALLAGDQRKSPRSIGRLDGGCGMNFPSDGRWGETQFAASAGNSRTFDLGVAARPLRTGAWWTLRLQLFPDGRCGIAINGRVLWVSTEPVSLDGLFRLRLGDESNGTMLLHGPLQVWTGVRSDIDWTPPVGERVPGAREEPLPDREAALQ